MAAGYHNLPEQTTETFVDGWYHTGDIAQIAESGHIRITDRKKDLFKTSGGKYVAPQKVEAAIQANIPYIAQSIAVGDGRKYVSALVVLDPALLQKWADKRGLQGSYAELSQRPEIHASIEKQMTRANAKLERWETVKKFAILDHELTVENSGVTANMKIRRGVVADTYSDLVDSLYPRATECSCTRAPALVGHGRAGARQQRRHHRLPAGGARRVPAAGPGLCAAGQRRGRRLAPDRVPPPDRL
ncbi:hypothetical protein [Tessaracoccus coleopterorum]